jgi:hypothetical protein
LGDGGKPTVERISPGDLVALVTDVVPVPMNARGVLILAGGGDAATAGSARQRIASIRVVRSW